MKFSTRTTYGLRAMIELGKNHGKDSMSLATIAKKENISLKYLERLFSKLKKENFIESEKGAGGGYRLKKRPNEISIYDIINTVEGRIAPFHCFGDNGKIYCEANHKCGAIIVLKKVQDSINKTLKSMSLDDLL